MLESGEELLRPERGLLQGSMISPALFNIYAESLIEEWQQELKVKTERVFGYADDHAIILLTVKEVRRAIKITEDWCLRNSIILNAKKSGVVEIPGTKKTTIRATQEWIDANITEEERKRRKKFKEKHNKDDPRWTIEGLQYIRTGTSTPKMKISQLVIGELIENVPIMATYKYLGVLLDNKLTLIPHLKWLTRKERFIYHKLYPMLRCCSFTLRANLWIVFISPNFRYIAPIIRMVNMSEIRREELAGMVRASKRKFLMLLNSIPNTTVEALLPFDTGRIGDDTRPRAEKKWERRKRRETIQNESGPKLRDSTKPFFPGNLAKIINLQAAECPRCSHTKFFKMGVKHITEKHWKELQDELKLSQPPTEVLDLIKEIRTKTSKEENVSAKLARRKT